MAFPIAIETTLALRQALPAVAFRRWRSADSAQPEANTFEPFLLPSVRGESRIFAFRFASEALQRLGIVSVREFVEDAGHVERGIAQLLDQAAPQALRLQMGMDIDHPGHHAKRGTVDDLVDLSGVIWIDMDQPIAVEHDIDALAMDDECHTPYRSHVDGVAHACGHDVHTAIVLGAGLFFAQNPPAGRVRLIFEPAEETVPGGAVDVIDEGHLDDVGVIFGLHCDPKKHVGTIGLRTGPVSSASDLVRITLDGPGGHTARPEATVDLVAVTSELALRLPQVLTERVERADRDARRRGHLGGRLFRGRRLGLTRRAHRAEARTNRA